MVPQLDQWRQRAEPVAERAHVAQIGGVHAVLTGANELGGLRLRVTLLVQLVQERVPDVVPRHLVLLARRRPGKAALRELRREIRVRRERERAGADAAAEDAFECERARVAPQPELNRSARARELRGRQSFQPLDRERSSRRTNSLPPAADGRCLPCLVGRISHVPGSLSCGMPIAAAAARTMRRADSMQVRHVRASIAERTRDPVAERHGCDAVPSAGPRRLRRDDRRRGTRQRKQQRGRDRRRRDTHAQRRHAAVARGIEHGEHATFELSWTRHADREGRRAMAARTRTRSRADGRHTRAPERPPRSRGRRTPAPARCAAAARPTTRPDGTSTSCRPQTPAIA